MSLFKIHGLLSEDTQEPLARDAQAFEPRYGNRTATRRWLSRLPNVLPDYRQDRIDVQTRGCCA
jgi:hypothetical protein